MRDANLANLAKGAVSVRLMLFCSLFRDACLTCERLLRAAAPLQRQLQQSGISRDEAGRKELDEETRGDAQRGGDWFAVHAVSGIRGGWEYCASSRRTLKEKKKSLAISAERSLWNWKSSHITGW